jgi:hypothetical protein
MNSKSSGKIGIISGVSFSTPSFHAADAEGNDKGRQNNKKPHHGESALAHCCKLAPLKRFYD